MKNLRQQEESLTEHWFFRVLIGLMLIAVLFFTASRYLSDVYDDVGEYKASLMADRFVKSVSHMHQQWITTGKPTLMTLDYYETANSSKEIEVQMNKSGWPLNIGTDTGLLNCEQLWIYFAETELIESDASTIEIVQQRTSCSYYWQSGGVNKKVLEYDVHVGRMTQNH